MMRKAIVICIIIALVSFFIGLSIGLNNAKSGICPPPNYIIEKEK